MARNVEIKAKVSNRAALIAAVEMIADRGPIEIFQEDIFFAVNYGRLKLRILSPSQGQMIFYNRPDICGPKESSYTIYETADPGQLREALELSLGIKGTVRKKRLLYMYGNTRIHIDDVEGLGNYLELEVVLDDSSTIESGQNTAKELMARLGIQPVDLIERAYVDMLNVNLS